MSSEWSRRRVLAGVGTAVAGSGCLGGSPRGDDQSTTTTRATTTIAEMPPPDASMPTVSTFPAEFGATVSLPAGEPVGWVLDASFTMAVEVLVAPDSESSVTAAVTERELATAEIPEDAVWSETDTESAYGDAVEITGGTGSVVVVADEETTARVSVETTLI